MRERVAVRDISKHEMVDSLLRVGEELRGTCGKAHLWSHRLEEAGALGVFAFINFGIARGAASLIPETWLLRRRIVPLLNIGLMLSAVTAVGGIGGAVVAEKVEKRVMGLADNLGIKLY